MAPSTVSASSTTPRQVQGDFGRFHRDSHLIKFLSAQSGRSRGFCFVYYQKLEDAMNAKESCSGLEIDFRRIRVDYSITQRPHTPTPGVYKGRPVRGRDDDRGYRRRSESRSPSREHSRRRYRSPSRSYSPRDRKILADWSSGHLMNSTSPFQVDTARWTSTPCLWFENVRRYIGADWSKFGPNMKPTTLHLLIFIIYLYLFSLFPYAIVKPKRNLISTQDTFFLSRGNFANDFSIIIFIRLSLSGTAANSCWISLKFFHFV